ncbi:hypothetical protein LQ948_13285 [Jiella sp. MQZ9-1]|uniref:Uncharacterized protein n=1 Tax=Jiella flava TaxID=2816857 RepID=A0A939G0J1_9HYPH|nr:hypothetical protein [Jiella flava]MCD2472185.1 hypothetical protein [Jiella flava]
MPMLLISFVGIASEGPAVRPCPNRLNFIRFAQNFEKIFLTAAARAVWPQRKPEGGTLSC